MFQVYVYDEFLDTYFAWGLPHDSERRAEKQAAKAHDPTRIVRVEIARAF